MRSPVAVNTPPIPYLKRLSVRCFPTASQLQTYAKLGAEGRNMLQTVEGIVDVNGQIR